MARIAVSSALLTERNHNVSFAQPGEIYGTTVTSRLPVSPEGSVAATVAVPVVRSVASPG